MLLRRASRKAVTITPDTRGLSRYSNLKTSLAMVDGPKGVLPILSNLKLVLGLSHSKKKVFRFRPTFESKESTEIWIPYTSRVTKHQKRRFVWLTEFHDYQENVLDGKSCMIRTSNIFPNFRSLDFSFLVRKDFATLFSGLSQSIKARFVRFLSFNLGSFKRAKRTIIERRVYTAHQKIDTIAST